MGVGGSALLASLKGRGQAEIFAFYAFLILALDGLGQILSPLGWPLWPAMALVVAALAVAETLPVALGFVALASLLAVAEAAAASFEPWKPALAMSLGYLALVLVLNRALLGEKHRLTTALAELARLHHGIDQLEETESGSSKMSPTALTLRQVSEDGRRARQLDRAAELDEALRRMVKLARTSVAAHAILYFDVDREREVAYLRAFDGPDAIVSDAVVPLGEDPFAFVLDRRQAFYATDFKRLLWSLPYYKREVKIGSLLAIPVRSGDAVLGVLVADRLEIQSFTSGEPDLLEAFAEMAADSLLRLRASVSREELGAEFKAVYVVSRNLATLMEQGPVRRLLLRSARDLVPFEGGAVVMADEAQTRYLVAEASGWPKEFEGRVVALEERTWAAWVLRSAEEPYLLDSVQDQKDRMPILVLDEGSSRAESLLALPLKARNRTLGALILTGRRGTFDAAVHRVLGILSNQAAAALSTIELVERIKELAVRDALTGLYNRRMFNEHLLQALARQERGGGNLALVLLDIDHFKKLNDTFGHPAGDAALKNAAQILEQHLRKGDQAARFGGEEFVVILPGTDEGGALRLAERIRSAIERSQLVFEGARISVTASFGTSIWPSDGADGEALLSAADRALYSAKHAGRNRVALASRLRSKALEG